MTEPPSPPKLPPLKDPSGAGRRGLARLAAVHVGQTGPARVEGAEEDALDGPEQEGGRDDETEARHDRRNGPDLERAHEGQELAHEPGKPRQAQRGEDHQPEEAGVDRHLHRQAAEIGEIARVRAVIEDPHEDKERASTR